MYLTSLPSVPKTAKATPALSGIFGGLPMDVIYNVGDAINKIGFGLVVYNLAVSSK